MIIKNEQIEQYSRLKKLEVMLTRYYEDNEKQIMILKDDFTEGQLEISHQLHQSSKEVKKSKVISVVSLFLFTINLLLVLVVAFPSIMELLLGTLSISGFVGVYTTVYSTLLQNKINKELQKQSMNKQQLNRLLNPKYQTVKNLMDSNKRIKKSLKETKMLMSKIKKQWNEEQALVNQKETKTNKKVLEAAQRALQENRVPAVQQEYSYQLYKR